MTLVRGYKDPCNQAPLRGLTEVWKIRGVLQGEEEEEWAGGRALKARPGPSLTKRLMSGFCSPR